MTNTAPHARGTIVEAKLEQREHEAEVIRANGCRP